MRTPFKRLSPRASRAPLFAFALCCTIGATLLAPSDAAASGYLTARYGSDDGTPAMANAYAIYFNPGALGGTKGTTITGDVSAVVRWASYERTTDALSPSDPNSKNDPAYVSANTGRAPVPQREHRLRRLRAVPRGLGRLHSLRRSGELDEA